MADSIINIQNMIEPSLENLIHWQLYYYSNIYYLYVCFAKKYMNIMLIFIMKTLFQHRWRWCDYLMLACFHSSLLTKLTEKNIFKK